MPPPDDQEALWDMRDAARMVAQAMADIESGVRSRDDWVLEAAIERKLEIIGEAVKRLTPAFREAHPEVDWRGWTGLRDVIAHRYDELDEERIGFAAATDVPELLKALEDLLPPDS